MGAGVPLPFRPENNYAFELALFGGGTQGKGRELRPGLLGVEPGVGAPGCTQEVVPSGGGTQGKGRECCVAGSLHWS